MISSISTSLLPCICNVGNNMTVVINQAVGADTPIITVLQGSAIHQTGIAVRTGIVHIKCRSLVGCSKMSPVFVGKIGDCIIRLLFFVTV